MRNDLFSTRPSQTLPFSFNSEPSARQSGRRSEINFMTIVSLFPESLYNRSRYSMQGIIMNCSYRKYILRMFSGMDANIICTTVSAEVMLSYSTHSCVMPTAPMQ